MKKNCIFIIQYLLLSVFMGIFTHGVAAQWPVRDFEVFFGEPWRSSNPDIVTIGRYLTDEKRWDLDNEQVRPSNISNATKLEIEAYLGAVARQYESMGFLQPVLEPVINRPDGTRAFRIYLYDHSLAAPAAYSSDCAGGVLRRTIGVDLSNPKNPAALTIGSDGRISEKGYQDLAHELFHAVQASYPLFRNNCELGDWIVEGTADALGVDMARKLAQVDLAHTSYRWGMRRYHTPLRVRDDPPDPRRQDAYQSASLWRYIGEKVTLPGGNPGLNFVEPDYSYLHKFFLADISGKASENSELSWLDEQLEAHGDLLLGLDRLYPNFISTFAGYIHNRLVNRKYPGITGRNIWLGEVFGSCRITSPNSGSPPARLQFDLKKVAAGCFILNTDITDVVDVAISVRAQSKSDLQALAIGTAGGAKVGQPIIVHINNEHIAYWLFHTPRSAVEQPVFVISNVANDPASTRGFKVDMEISVSAWDSELLAP